MMGEMEREDKCGGNRARHMLLFLISCKSSSSLSSLLALCFRSDCPSNNESVNAFLFVDIMGFCACVCVYVLGSCANKFKSLIINFTLFWSFIAPHSDTHLAHYTSFNSPSLQLASHLSIRPAVCQLINDVWGVYCERMDWRSNHSFNSSQVRVRMVTAAPYTKVTHMHTRISDTL